MMTYGCHFNSRYLCAGTQKAKLISENLLKRIYHNGYEARVSMQSY